ncbi:MAG: CpsD/CapB family tyrosine-protein kinase [Deltaproteobacteria bacterium]|nr:CpsD/CapB family tyrosine-protein kinase [Deltaproteobacteria bacterium]
MSKFYQALQRAEQEHALQRRKREDIAVGVAAPPARHRAEPNLRSRPEEIARERSKPLSPPPIVTPTGVDNHLVSLLASPSFEAEQYRTLCHLVEQLHEKAELSVIAISSAAPGDGKTTTAINLAGALTQASGARVLLIDFDLRRPSISEYLGDGEGAHPGILDLIRDPNLALDDLTVTFPSLLNLRILYAGGAVTAPYEVFKSFQVEEILAEARRQYDYVILDTPPIVPFPDCRLLERIVDGFLLVVAAHKTPRRLVEEAINILDPDKVVGLIFNKDDNRSGLGSSDYDAYYQYKLPRSRNGQETTFVGRFIKKCQALFRSVGDR